MKDYSVQHGKLYQIDLNQHGAQAKPTGTNDIATLLSSFHLNGHTLGFHLLTQKGHLVQDNKQYHRKVLLSNFHLNGHTLGFHPQT